MSAVMGFFGGILSLIATIVATAAAITFFIVLWKSGALPEAAGWVTALISGLFNAVTGFFSFLGDLLSFAKT
jgi:hypothetical protein